MRIRSVLMAVVLIPFVSVALLGIGQTETEPTEVFRVGVFVPGVVEGSPTYELLTAGVRRAAAEKAGEIADAPSVTVKVVEGGFNQALWEQGLTSMAASDEYDLIVSSNPEIPDIVDLITESFPSQRFLIMDAHRADNPSVHTVMFNQREQAFRVPRRLLRRPGQHERHVRSLGPPAGRAHCRSGVPDHEQRDPARIRVWSAGR